MKPDSLFFAWLSWLLFLLVWWVVELPQEVGPTVTNQLVLGNLVIVLVCLLGSARHLTEGVNHG